jgi:hypothetical protein
MKQAWTVIAVAALLAGLAQGALGQAELPQPIEQRLAGFADRMRLSLSMASVAVFSPSISDAHGQAQRLIALLRGDARDGIPGLVAEAVLFADWIGSRPFDPEPRRVLLGAATNVQALLRLALDAAIAANRDRALDNATQDLLRVYAYLVAAWGKPIDGVVVPGLETLLRGFDVAVTA